MTLFKCAGCDETFTKEKAKKHTKNGGICTTAYPTKAFFADDESEEEIDEMQNKEKKKDEKSRKAEEHEKEELRKKTPEQLDSILQALTDELDELKKQKTKKSKQASKKYDVLLYNNFDFQSDSHNGDELIESLGSRD